MTLQLGNRGLGLDHPFCTYDLKIDICLSFKKNSIPIRFWIHPCLLKSQKYFLNYFELFRGKDHGLSRNQMYPSYLDVILLLHQLEVLSGLLDVSISGFAILCFDARTSAYISRRARRCPSLQPLGDLCGASAYPRKLQAWGEPRMDGSLLSGWALQLFSREVLLGKHRKSSICGLRASRHRSISEVEFISSW